MEPCLKWVEGDRGWIVEVNKDRIEEWAPGFYFMLRYPEMFRADTYMKWGISRLQQLAGEIPVTGRIG